MDQAQQEATNIIVQAEQMKATLNPQQGKTYRAYSDLVDDEFFHIMCHVKDTLKGKIEAGQFVDLEKLLIKDRPFSSCGVSDNQRMGLFNKDGLTYFAPAGEREGKITNIHKWEQAFRVHAAIYSKVNPNRASEIWQYVYVINSAANSYHWDNVAEYDYTFRHLMATYPECS